MTFNNNILLFSQIVPVIHHVINEDHIDGSTVNNAKGHDCLFIFSPVWTGKRVFMGRCCLHLELMIASVSVEDNAKPGTASFQFDCIITSGYRIRNSSSALIKKDLVDTKTPNKKLNC